MRAEDLLLLARVEGGEVAVVRAARRAAAMSSM